MQVYSTEGNSFDRMKTILSLKHLKGISESSYVDRNVKFKLGKLCALAASGYIFNI